MHVNNTPFLISLSGHFHYGMIGAVDYLRCETLEDSLKLVVRAYAIREFRIALILVNTQFEDLKHRNLVSVAFNVVSRDGYAPKIERFVRVIKERGRCYYRMTFFLTSQG